MLRSHILVVALLLSLSAAVCLGQVSEAKSGQLPLETKRERLHQLLTRAVGSDEGTLCTLDSVVVWSKVVHVWASKAAPDSDEATREKLKQLEHLYPSVKERWARVEQVKVELIEQPKTIFIEDPKTLVLAQSLNPTHYLVRNSFLLKPSELFATSELIAAQAAMVKDSGGKTKDPDFYIKNFDSFLCSKGAVTEANLLKIVHCLNQSGKRGTLFRAIQGTTGTISYGSNPQVQQNINIPSSSPIASANHLFAGEVAFDPASLFVSGTDWKNGQASAVVYGKAVENAYEEEMFRLCHPEGQKQLSTQEKKTRLADDPACILRLSEPRGMKRVAAALIPQVDYKIQTQFDFLKSGANLVAAAFPEGHLWDVTFTADLRRAFTLFKPRADYIAATTAVLQPAKSKESDTENAKKTPRQVVDAFMMDWSSEPELLEDDGWYERFRAAITSVLLAEPTLRPHSEI